jgi:hypothetical protein
VPSGYRRGDSSAALAQTAWFSPLIEAGPPPKCCFLEDALKDLSEAQESPFFTRKRIAVAIAILTVCGIALWMSLEMLLRMTSGQS